ncbi:MAG TPA: BPSS1780 family membrane protein [Macromonas sp.]|nr:BPSS1780 family membrane protein [Macromonas sp.]
MKMHYVPARTGLQWVKQGLRAFWRHPLSLTGMFFLFMFVASLVAVLPIVGPLLISLLIPGVVAALMAAARESDAGNHPPPWLLVSPFRGRPERTKSLLALGGLNVLATIGVIVLSALVFYASNDHLDQLVNASNVTVETLQQLNLGQSLLTYSVLWAITTVLFSLAAALIYWHGTKAAESLFYSVLACWGNKGALAVFLLSWAVVFYVTALALTLIGQLFGNQELWVGLMTLLAMLLTTAFFASVFFVFRDSFTTDDGQPPA